MYTDNRDAYRLTFAMAWQKHLKQEALTQMEAVLVDVICEHPEYHAVLEKMMAYQHQEFEPEENPFLHMSLHIAIYEQLQQDRPAGINQIYLELTKKYANSHEVQHKIMQCLGQLMWQAQTTGNAIDEQDYLIKLRAL